VRSPVVGAEKDETSHKTYALPNSAVKAEPDQSVAILMRPKPLAFFNFSFFAAT
jgi:hypothetical protein